MYCVCYRSHIHGLGLYAKKTIDAGDMVVEYAGTLIRSVLTDKREKYYDEKVLLIEIHSWCEVTLGNYGTIDWGFP